MLPPEIAVPRETWYRVADRRGRNVDGSVQGAMLVSQTDCKYRPDRDYLSIGVGY